MTSSNLTDENVSVPRNIDAKTRFSSKVALEIGGDAGAGSPAIVYPDESMHGRMMQLVDFYCPTAMGLLQR